MGLFVVIVCCCCFGGLRGGRGGVFFFGLFSNGLGARHGTKHFDNARRDRCQVILVPAPLMVVSSDVTKCERRDKQQGSPSVTFRSSASSGTNTVLFDLPAGHLTHFI